MSYTIGIDIGGTKVLGGVVDAEGIILTTARRPTPSEGGEKLVEEIAAVARELADQYQVTNVGISTAGFISSDRNTILGSANIAGWNGLKLNDALTALIGLPVIIENDANAAAWGEVRYGAGRGKKNVLMLTCGTGVGGGIVVNGALLRGAFGIAAEIGHMNHVPNGILCGCGAHGCLEQYGSGTALVRFAKEAAQKNPEAAKVLLSHGDGTIDGISGPEITEAARDGDAMARGAFSTLGDHLGAGIASMCAILDPECVVIGGGVVDAGDILLDPIRKAFDKYIPFAGKHPYPEIIAAKLGNTAGLVGVADLARTL